MGEVVGKGGEGIVYAVSETLVCKIARPGRLDEAGAKKLVTMTSRPISHTGICWPSSIAYFDREPVGYFMPMAGGVELKTSVFVKPLLEKKFPTWTRLQLVQTALKTVDLIDYLHSMNVVLGDINGRNILVAEDTTVHLIDCDSFQVEGYGCPVGTPGFVPPELRAAKSLGDVVRTKRMDAFAVATLIFMILHPGKPPYSHQGGQGTAYNAQIAKHFPYPLGEVASDRLPAGRWRFMWSHLPRYMKEAFHGIFVNDDRLHAATWLELLERYESDLHKGYVSDEIFPTSFKLLTERQVVKLGGVWRSCTSCGDFFGAFRASHTSCPACHKEHTDSMEQS